MPDFVSNEEIVIAARKNLMRILHQRNTMSSFRPLA